MIARHINVMLLYLFNFIVINCIDMNRNPLVLSLVICTPLVFAADDATVLSPVTVSGERVAEPMFSYKDIKDVFKPSVDGGEFLRHIPGVDGVRMGGHGIDPIIRGQSKTQLNILLDGAYVHGGCPNRMDPPTAYSAIDTYDSVTVLKGFQTVIYGGGGSGGTVLFERKTPRFTADNYFRGKFGAGYLSNSETTTIFGDIAAGTTRGFARGIIEYKDAGNYEDGEGKETRAAFNNQTGNIIIGYTPSKNNRVELSIEASRTEDALYSGAGMDAPISDNDTVRLKYENEWGTKSELYYSEVTHLMDNYSLRTLAAPMKMATPTESTTKGGRLSQKGLTRNDIEWTLGIDYQHNNRDANRYSGPANMPTPTTLQSIMWPDVDLSQTGFFAEMEMPVRDVNLLKMGLRYDWITSEANRAHQVAFGDTSPNTLYSDYYDGATATEHEENNIGGFIRYEQDWSHSLTFINISRSVRTADATERYIAANHKTSSFRWVGNPDLDPEQHHQIELGFSLKRSTWNLGTSVYYNQVTDYILRDQAADKANIYRNVEAELYGVEWEIQGKWNEHHQGSLGVAYVHSTNTTDDRPIAQTPPLNATANIEYKNALVRLGMTGRAFAQQTRVDEQFDTQQTHGFAVLDLYSSIGLNKYMTLKFGLNNVFDRAYAYHVNRANVDPFNPEPIQVNEPGRSWWLNLGVTF